MRSREQRAVTVAAAAALREIAATAERAGWPRRKAREVAYRMVAAGVGPPAALALFLDRVVNPQ